MALTEPAEINAVGIRVGDTLLIADDICATVCSVGVAEDGDGPFVYVNLGTYDLRFELTERVALVARENSGPAFEPPAEVLLRVERLEQAVREAQPHVYRQQHHGKHEQDRLDAVHWLAEYGDLCAGS
jgi:hypothetical protein